MRDHARLKAATITATRREIEPEGFNTGLNLGEGAGGSIDHLHTHVSRGGAVTRTSCRWSVTRP